MLNMLRKQVIDMATLVEIEDCTYNQFAEVRKQMNERNRFGLSSETFIKEEKLAKFWFHDAKYIPIWMYRSKNIKTYVPDYFINDVVIHALREFDEQE